MEKKGVRRKAAKNHQSMPLNLCQAARSRLLSAALSRPRQRTVKTTKGLVRFLRWWHSKLAALPMISSFEASYPPPSAHHQGSSFGLPRSRSPANETYHGTTHSLEGASTRYNRDAQKRTKPYADTRYGVDIRLLMDALKVLTGGVPRRRQESPYRRDYSGSGYEPKDVGCLTARFKLCLSEE